MSNTHSHTHKNICTPAVMRLVKLFAMGVFRVIMLIHNHNLKGINGTFPWEFDTVYFCKLIECEFGRSRVHVCVCVCICVCARVRRGGGVPDCT